MQHASLVIMNGVVWAPGRPRATAIAIAGERIVAVGADADIRALASRSTGLIDARGGTIMPAFNDSHIHFLSGSRALRQLDLYGAETQFEVERMIREFATGRSGWVIGRGWIYAAFQGGMPTLELLDQLVPDRPAYMEAYDGHTAWVNSKALAEAGQPVVSLPGILKEAVMVDFKSHLPRPSTAEDLDSLGAGMRLAAEHGIASIQEAGHGLEQLPLYHALRESSELTLRVRLAFDMEPGLSLEDWNRRLHIYDEAARLRSSDTWISAGIVKAFADGVIESRTAAMLKPYEGMTTSEPGAFGAPNWERGALAEAVRAASARGWQVEVHAIGDAAIRDALDAFAQTDPIRRHRVEHIEAPAAEDIDRFARLGVIASMQPQHAEPNRNLVEAWVPKIGLTRASRGWPWASILRSGGRLAFGSDWPVVPIDPFGSLHVAVNRQTRSGAPGGGWLPAERLGLADAVAAWTSGGAYAEHAEQAKGELREDMLADVIVINRDLTNTPGDELSDIRVEATVVGGRLVYESYKSV